MAIGPLPLGIRDSHDSAHYDALASARDGLDPDKAKQRFQRFWIGFDLATDPAFFLRGLEGPAYYAGHQQLTATQRMIDLLIARVTARIETEPVPPVPSDLVYAVQLLSRVQVELFAKEFGGEAFDLAAFQQCFECFANGELELSVGDGLPPAANPSSGYFYFFAEFAFVALEAGADEGSGIDRGFWEQVVHVLVGAELMFKGAYETAGIDKTSKRLAPLSNKKKLALKSKYPKEGDAAKAEKLHAKQLAATFG